MATAEFRSKLFILASLLILSASPALPQALGNLDNGMQVQICWDGQDGYGKDVQGANNVIKVREKPTASGQELGTVSSGQYQSGQSGSVTQISRKGTIVDGPKRADGYVWWKVQFDKQGDKPEIEGWCIGDYLIALSDLPGLSKTCYNEDNPFRLDQNEKENHGQCTAFAWGRSRDKLGLEIPWRRNAGGWEVKGLTINDYHDWPHGTGEEPRRAAIAVWRLKAQDPKGNEGHVAFVEDVRDDKIYINEANFSEPDNIGKGSGYNQNCRMITAAGMKERGANKGYTLRHYIYLMPEGTDTPQEEPPQDIPQEAPPQGAPSDAVSIRLPPRTEMLAANNLATPLQPWIGPVEPPDKLSAATLLGRKAKTINGTLTLREETATETLPKKTFPADTEVTITGPIDGPCLLKEGGRFWLYVVHEDERQEQTYGWVALKTENKPPYLNVSAPALADKPKVEDAQLEKQAATDWTKYQYIRVDLSGGEIASFYPVQGFQSLPTDNDGYSLILIKKAAGTKRSTDGVTAPYDFFQSVKPITERQFNAVCPALLGNTVQNNTSAKTWPGFFCLNVSGGKRGWHDSSNQRVRDEDNFYTALSRKTGLNFRENNCQFNPDLYKTAPLDKRGEEHIREALVSLGNSDGAADSMKMRVQAAGGKVDGVLRFSIQWNDGNDNPNDFDAHCIEPNGNKIFYAHKINYETGGNLDVDIIHPIRGVPAAENITWPLIEHMKEGNYHFFVHNFSHRGGRNGFSAEIEFAGEITPFSCDRELHQDEQVPVVTVRYSRSDGFKIVSSRPSNANMDTWVPVHDDRDCASTGGKAHGGISTKFVMLPAVKK
ncbi:MAG: CHAP domain-containing protein [Kiritimatiellaeota bacterium]|nr:CHAP domain-containing protein [Kiritimatiellota bacterium]